MREGAGWHPGICVECDGTRNYVRAVEGHGLLCMVCLDRLEAEGDQAVLEVFADAA